MKLIRIERTDFMGLFNKKKKIDVWDDAYKAKPHFYKQSDGSVFGAMSLTEGVKTMFLKQPQIHFEVEGQRISQWRIALISTTNDSMIGQLDYGTCLKKLQPYILAEDSNFILVRGLTLDELKSL
ncbi:hypothetical protein B5E48_06065 [Massilimicrobiota sp. An105]|nr:hypothetical protein B5E48_06065 [Massilimicrobiota sp. An105]